MKTGLIVQGWKFFAVMLFTSASALHADSTNVVKTVAAEAAIPNKPSLEEISKKLDNPLSDLWMLWMQNDYMQFSGDAVRGHHNINVTYFEPVISVPLGDRWNLVNRPVFTYINADVPTLGRDAALGFIAGKNFGGTIDSAVSAAVRNAKWKSKSGWGDLIYLSMISPQELPTVGNGKLAWGTGVTTMFPTASRDYFGTEKYSAGPAVLGLYKGPKWMFGALAQQWWSFAGDDDRADVNQMNVQYFWFYSLPHLWQIGAAPNITANWEADHDDRWSVPLGIGVNKTVLIGRLPVRFSLEYHQTIVQPDSYGEDWGVRLTVIPVIPNLVEMAQGKLKLP